MEHSTVGLPTNQRIVYFDVLRIMAIAAVVFLHMSGQKWRYADVMSTQWQMMNIYNSLTRWCVPVLVMISGALILRGECDIGRLHKKNILRMITAYAFWSLLYAAVDFVRDGDRQDAFVNGIQGHFHLWFLPMIVGLYLIAPFLKKIVASGKLTRYFLVLALIFSCLLPHCVELLFWINEDLGRGVSAVIGNANVQLTGGYAGYYVLGYCLSRKSLPPRGRRLLYLSSAAGFVFTILGTFWVSQAAGNPDSRFYENFTWNVLAESVGVFLIIQSCFEKRGLSQKAEALVSRLSKYSFGVYLVHILVMDVLDKELGINALSFHPVVSIPLLGALVLAVSFGISAGLSRIPVLNKYIV